MVERGDSYFNPVTKTRIVFVTPARETGGLKLEVDWFVPPGERLPSAAHIHGGPEGGGNVEFFDVLAGEAACKVGGATLTGRAPHTFAVPFNTAHVHPWNTGSTELHVRQRIEPPIPSLDVLQGVERFFETLIALSQQGRADRDGSIRNPLQGALTLQDTLLPGTYVAGIPRAVQVAMFGTLAALARGLGYSATLTPQKS